MLKRIKNCYRGHSRKLTIVAHFTAENVARRQQIITHSDFGD